ncbi:hypothetical protein QE152_g29908 [Popillia japonica]|uniref:Replication associated protein n=1 Tax=Popillia japonica TaxID=7064 RepID=A0AAW1JGP8_POPJA
MTDLSNYQPYRWAIRTSTVNHADPFVVRHNRRHRYISQYLMYLKFALAREASARVRFTQKDVCYRNWTMDVSQWWNRYCCAERFQFKRPCLFLYGWSDVGKTAYSLIGRHNLRYVFRPGIGNFFMQDFRADFHRVILFEEFDYKAHNLPLLRRLCEDASTRFRSSASEICSSHFVAR